MRLRFNEAKATQAACRLLQLRGGTMSYLKLIKLLYLVDREALLRWGRPVTTGRYISMAHGPVVSQIYDLIREEIPPGRASFWCQHVSEPNHAYEVSLIKDPGNSELSPAEDDLLIEVFRQHGSKTRWELVELCHALPEWEDPHGSAFPIELRDILKAGRKTDTEIAAIEDELENIAAVQALVGPLDDALR
jgi:uncharacterized phage-associated protein